MGKKNSHKGRFYDMNYDVYDISFVYYALSVFLLPFAAKLVSPKGDNKSKQTNNGFKEHLVLYSPSQSSMFQTHN